MLVKMAEPAETLGEEKTNKKPLPWIWMGRDGGYPRGARIRWFALWLLAGGGRTGCVRGPPSVRSRLRGGVMGDEKVEGW